jgi:hypothetical protein
MMSSEDIIRAWKDPDHPEASGVDHPAGEIQLVADVAGGNVTSDPCLNSLFSVAIPLLLPWCIGTS